MKKCGYDECSQVFKDKTNKKFCSINCGKKHTNKTNSIKMQKDLLEAKEKATKKYQFIELEKYDFDDDVFVVRNYFNQKDTVSLRRYFDIHNIEKKYGKRNGKKVMIVTINDMNSIIYKQDIKASTSHKLQVKDAIKNMLRMRTVLVSKAKNQQEENN